MRLRVLSAALLALAGAVVMFVSLQARAADTRVQPLRAAAIDGVPHPSAGSPAAKYLAALAGFANDQKNAGAKETGQRAAAIASAEQAVHAALAAGQPTAQRSQLENLYGILELEQSALGGDQIAGQHRAAARWLQEAVLDDDTNADAKFNLELLISQDPQSAKRQQQSPQPAPGANNKRAKHNSPARKKNSPSASQLGAGF
jgi:chemotaxis response regulator CheB